MGEVAELETNNKTEPTGTTERENKRSKNKNRNKGRFTIRKRLIIAFTGILLIPSIVIGAVIFFTSSQSIISEVTSNSKEMVKQVNGIIDDKISNKMLNVEYLGRQVTNQMLGPEARPQLIGILDNYMGLNSDVDNVFIATAQGDIIQATDGKMKDSPAEVQKSTWFTDAMTTADTTFVSPVVINREKLPVIYITRQLKEGAGVLGLTLNLQVLQRSVSVKLGDTGYIMVLDNKRQYVVNPNAKQGTVAADNYVNDIFKTDGNLTELSYTEKGTALNIQTVENVSTGWRIAAVRNQIDINNQAATSFYVSIGVLVGALALGAIVIVFIIRSIVGPIRKLQQETESVSQGDLTSEIEAVRNDEIGDLAANFSLMVQNLREMIVNVQRTTNNVSTSAEALSLGAEQTTNAIEHVTVTIQEVASGSERQLQSVEVGSDSIEDMTGKVVVMSDNLKNVTGRMSQTIQVAEDGNTSVLSVVEKIENINQTVEELSQVIHTLNGHTEHIGGIVTVITDIAQQTNLLALNASIEAARAGEHGRGFAVVAEEVRKLASDSEQSAHQIGDLIQGIQGEVKRAMTSMEQAVQRVEEGILAVDSTGRSFSRIRKAVKEVAAKVDEVTSAAVQLAEGAETVNATITEIRRISEESAGSTQTISAAAEEQLASVEEIASSSADLSRMADELQGLVGKFKIPQSE
ncbi:methyl-accepting chemotaxis protein [Paenibacillus tuaregi]|uniref:methyl-accepting chemotaxis protein n=1 Tax=Paenibacillus tuaregi TaxID=1816681 RepID=UPI000AF4B5DD|nr:methyl-accepting chemotaxis protein [Paenibacillus tuaregi]